ncbi:MAG: type VII toxin-antitoxin system MntA family adenylyltransferase antitoxin [Thermodesulfobacteriota bacterium]
MKNKLKKELKKLGVNTIYLFGSKAIRRASELSDVDLGFVFKEIPAEEDISFFYNNLYELFSEIFPDAKLDIVFLQRASLPLQYMAIKEGKVIFEDDLIFTADYEYNVIKNYIDFAPILEMFDKIMFEKYVIA